MVQRKLIKLTFSAIASTFLLKVSTMTMSGLFSFSNKCSSDSYQFYIPIVIGCHFVIHISLEALTSQFRPYSMIKNDLSPLLSIALSSLDSLTSLVDLAFSIFCLGLGYLFLYFPMMIMLAYYVFVTIQVILSLRRRTPESLVLALCFFNLRGTALVLFPRLRFKAE